jgi:integrase
VTSKQISTDRQVAALKTGAKPYEVGVEDSRGLCVRVFPTGTKQFELRYTAVNGSRRRHLLGGYPDLSLSDARTKAASLRVSVVDGSDPAAERAAKREQARTGETFAELAEAYWKAAEKGLHGGRKRPKRASTIATERMWWKNHIAKKLGSRRFSELRRADIKIFMRELATDSGLSAASVASVGALIQAVLGFAVHEDRLDANPAIGLARPLALTSRERLFSDDAMSTIWAAAVEASLHRRGREREDIHARLGPEMGLAIRLLVMTLTRRTEVGAARKSEFDRKAGLWTIPSERAKAKHLHVVPLTSEALEIVNAAWERWPRSEFLFPSASADDGHLDPHAITRAFARICTRQKLGAGSPHDVRRTGATTLTGRYGVSRFVVGLLLGHTPKDGAAVTSVYDRHTYLPEKKAALEKWAKHVVGLSAGAKAA